jgi:hypothetical protein
MRQAPSRAPTARLLPPCAQASTIRARSARPCAVLRRLTQFSNVRRSSPGNTSGSSLLSAIPPADRTRQPADSGVSKRVRKGRSRSASAPSFRTAAGGKPATSPSRTQRHCPSGPCARDQPPAAFANSQSLRAPSAAGGRPGLAASGLARRSASVRMPVKEERTAASQAAATRSAHHWAAIPKSVPSSPE